MVFVNVLDQDAWEWNSIEFELDPVRMRLSLDRFPDAVATARSCAELVALLGVEEYPRKGFRYPADAVRGPSGRGRYNVETERPALGPSVARYAPKRCDSV